MTELSTEVSPDRVVWKQELEMWRKTLPWQKE
jgi:hypothetical protein